MFDRAKSIELTPVAQTASKVSSLQPPALAGETCYLSYRFWAKAKPQPWPEKKLLVN
jgi:hypothetical protein